MSDHPNDAAPSNGTAKSTTLALRPKGDSQAESQATDQESCRFYGPWPTEGDTAEPQPDFPIPRALREPEVFVWHEEVDSVVNYARLGKALAKSDDLFRVSGYGGGLFLASKTPNIPPARIDDAQSLAPVIADRIRVRRYWRGNLKPGGLPASVLACMVHSEAFLQGFRPVDTVERWSRYLPDLRLSAPGFNDGGFGHRVLQFGPKAWVEPHPDAIRRFLDVMPFASNADRTNALAALLTVQLRHCWPGGKPILAVTSTKSHGGKETIVQFAAGTTRRVSISYERQDWAVEKAFVVAVKADPEVGLVDVENARLDGGVREIRSAFLERLATDPEPQFFSPGAGAPFVRRNDIVVAITTNYGCLSEDLLNRSLPVHLAPVGDVASRVSPIGNPRFEYLPENCERIEAEARGLVEFWRAQRRPLDMTVRHPFSLWARTIGGILKENGFTGFLDNYAMRRTADDPVRRGLGLLGAARPSEWLPAHDWAGLVRGLGLVKQLIPEGDRSTDIAHERGIGIVLSAHIDETFEVETEDQRFTLCLKKARRRFEEGAEPSTRYRFEAQVKEIPEDQS